MIEFNKLKDITLHLHKCLKLLRRWFDFREGSRLARTSNRVVFVGGATQGVPELAEICGLSGLMSRLVLQLCADVHNINRNEIEDLQAHGI